MSNRMSGYVVMLLAFAATQLSARTLNGFDIGRDALIPVDEIHSGGPPRDGIPSIDRPRFVAADGAHELGPDDRVLGLVYRGVARAYPIAIMNWHEIVNDRIGDDPLVVTYCPLCGSGVAYTALVDGIELEFGVSGLLYNSDVLLYDRQTESLWSQILSRAVSGTMRGKRLAMQPLVHTSWAAWVAAQPQTEVLSRDTGARRDYDRDPYSGYQDSKGVWFPVAKKDPRYHPKERVLGVELGGRFKAYPFAELSKSTGAVQDSIGGVPVTLRYDAAGESAQIFDRHGEALPAIVSFWFAWYAFHPETEVYEAP
jgi:hypothetical protein